MIDGPQPTLRNLSADRTAPNYRAAMILELEGFDHLELQRCLETPDRYVLLVGWDHLEDRTQGFRGSPEFERWKGLLHHFYDPFPTVEHYESVFEVARPS